MTVTIEVCTTIDAAPDAVWSTLEPIETHVEWMQDAESIRFVTASHRGVGAAFVCTTAVGPIRLRDEMRVTRWEPATAMGIEHRGAVTGTGEFRLEPQTAGSTRFCWEEQLRFPWWLGGPVGERIGRPILARIWRRNLDALRQLVEQREGRDR